MGATKQFADTAKIKELKAYIIQNSLTNEHILFTDITEDIELRENIEKENYVGKKEEMERMFRIHVQLPDLN